MKSLIVFTFLSSLVCFQSFAMGSRRQVPSPSPTPVQVDKPDPGFILLTPSVQASPANIQRINRLVGVASKIVNSEKFKRRMLGAWYQGKAQFVDTNLSNEQVYDAIRKGNELRTGNDYEWDLFIGVDRARCSTLGWGYSGQINFFFNSCRFESRTDAGLTGTIVHEYIHKLGFYHDKKPTARREYSVPYAAGTIAAELYNEFK